MLSESGQRLPGTSAPHPRAPHPRGRRTPWLVLFGLPALLLAALFSLSLPAPTASAATLAVCASGATYTTIQAAVNAATPGDVIQICAGTYPESVNLTTMARRGDITLRGTGAVTIAPAAGPALLINSLFPGSVTVDNLRLTSPNADGLNASGTITGNLALLNVTIAKVGGSGVLGAVNGSVLVSGTNIVSSTSYGLYVNVQGSFLAQNSSFNHNGLNGVSDGLFVNASNTNSPCGVNDRIQFANVTADNNGYFGINAFAYLGGITVRGSRANGNLGNGFMLQSTDTCGAFIKVDGSVTNGNGDPLFNTGVGMSLDGAYVTVANSTADGNVCHGIEQPYLGISNCGLGAAAARQAPVDAAAINPQGEFAAANSTTNNNGADGFYIGRPQQLITLTNVTANVNRTNGIYMLIDDGQQPVAASASQAVGADATIANALIMSNAVGIVIDNQQFVARAGAQAAEATTAGALASVNPVGIGGSIVCGNALAGLSATGPLSNTYDATGNYWGSFAGPLHGTKNPDGTGNEILDSFSGNGNGDVLFNPWISGILPTANPSSLRPGGQSQVAFQPFGTNVLLGAGPGNLNDLPPFTIAAQGGSIRTAFGQGAAAPARIDAAGNITGLLTANNLGLVNVTLSGPCGLTASQRLVAVNAAINMVKSVGTDPNACAAPGPLTVDRNTPVYFCLRVTNTGDVTFTNHTVADPALGVTGAPITVTLAPAASVAITHGVIPALGPVTVTGTITNVAGITSTATVREIGGVEVPGFSVQATAANGVVVRPQPTGLDVIAEPGATNKLYLPTVHK